MIVLKLADGSTLHDVRDNDRQVIGYISDAKNAVGTLDFDIYPKHPAYNAIKAGSTKIRAYRDGIWTHDYTVESVTNDLQLKKHVTATDELQYLERIEVPSYKTVVGGVPKTVSGLFMWLVEYYNVRSGGERFAFGQIEGDIIDPTKTLDRSSDSPATVASIVKDKIIDSLGGYVRVRRDNGVLTIDLKADAAGVCSQYIEFGENLVDYADEQDASELYTAITAESTYKDDNGDEVTITLADAPDGDYLTGYVKQGDTVTNTAAAAAYGVRRKHLTFDGIKNVYTLVENCEKYIAAHCEPVTTVNVSAADLSILDSNVQSFDVGLYTRVKAAPMGFDAAFECQSAKRSLTDPTEDKYTLGWTWGSLSSINNRKIVETALGIGRLEQASAEIDQTAKEAAQQAQTAQDVANAANINAIDAVTKADSATEGATIASDTAQRAEAISAEAKQTATEANGVAQDASETASTAASTATQAKNTATQTASDLSNYATNTNLMLEDMQGQIDGSITTWFFAVPPTNENAPANEWTTTDLKNNHLGDLYYDTDTGYSYRWQVLQSVYSWQRITDVDVTKALADASKAQDTADAKRRVFYSQPVPPYDKGDLWSQGTNGEMLICATPKTDGMSFLSSDWDKATKYTDDSAAEAAQAEATAAQTFQCASNTAGGTAAKVPASTVAGFTLHAGVTLSVKFTYANTASSPTLNVNGTGAKAIMVDGANAGYWRPGSTLLLTFDGTYWQAVVPVYGATSTIGNPAAGNVYTDGSGMSVRQGSTALARFMENLIELGIDSVDALIKLCAGALTISVDDQGRASLLAPEKIIQVGGANGAYVYAGAASNYGSLGINTSGTVPDYGAGTLAELGSTSSRGGGISIARLGLFSPSTARQKSKAVFEVEQIVYSGAVVPKLFVGTKVVTVATGGNAARLWTQAEFAASFGRKFDQARDFVGVMNADGSSSGAHVQGATYVSGELWMVQDITVAEPTYTRVNYFVALAS